ncbi:MAG: plasmid-related protein [Bacillota bacterium]|nr:plasmid-related protein [Bacillota bacterium]
MTNIVINPYAISTQLVGIIPEAVVKYYCINCSSYEVFMPPGVLKHLKKHDHWDDFLQYHTDIPNMIAVPDYAGQNPKEPGTIELYKVMSEHILIAIKMNPNSGLFLGSFYKLDNGAQKIQKRLRTGRIHPFSFFV